MMQQTRPRLSERIAPIRSLFVGDAAGGVLLILAAACATALANSPLGDGYHALFHHALAWTPIARLDTLHLWINDGLMAIFFFVVGLEVKRELIAGQLSTATQRRLPVLAAAAGMMVPAAIYWLLTPAQPPLDRGWGIPVATDIAFAMGVVGLLGQRVPMALRLFLLTVAIVDDIGAVLVIALAYTSQIELGWVSVAVLVVLAMAALNRLGVTRAWPYLVLAVALWLAVLYSGVHATIAGVVAALTIPMGQGNGLLERLEHRLIGWNAYAIVPLFGFANAGVSLAGLGLAGMGQPLPLAIAAGLVIGKQAGIFATIFAADRLGIAPRPAGASWSQIWGMAILCGIGFTMSLFITALAFPHHPQLVEEAKIGVLAGSLVSAILGYCVLRFASQPR